MAEEVLLYALSYLLIFFGLIGSVLPVVPGPLLIFLGSLLWASVDGFDAIGWPTLVLLFVLTLIAWGSDLIMTTLLTRRTGASWKSVLGAIIGGLIGGIFFGGWIPIVGTIVATLAGAVVGVIAMEWLDKRNVKRAFEASKGYLAGFVLASLLEAGLAVLMILLFAWQAFLSG